MEFTFTGAVQKFDKQKACVVEFLELRKGFRALRPNTSATYG